MDNVLWPLILALALLVALDLSALRWGHDSRSTDESDLSRW